MEKTYNPQNIEQNWYQHWEKNHYFQPSGKGESYCIMIPPPNVTGSLHMGHGFQYSLMDALIRYHRMRGFNTLWQVGTDHAGIATQMLVERKLIKEQGKTRHDLGREAFLKAVYEWKNTSGNTITKQMRRLGTSVDWSRERFTMDDGISHAVREVFIRLYEEGLIYRGKRLVNWDPKLHTAISDLEVINEEKPGELFYIRYPLVDDKNFIVVATSRPETLFGDVAVAVHPDDERYKDFIGKKIKLPLTDREIPIIADDAVTIEFGTGCVKITPAHDFNDYAMAQRHQLPMINILTIDACLNENVPANYQGLDRFVARQKAVDALKQLQLLEKIENYTIKVPRGDRSDAIIEPYLTDQWFVKIDAIAKEAIRVVENGEIQFIPDNWKNTYFQWMNNIQDWCISRQLWWGHRIPAWYDDAGNVYVGEDETAVRKKYSIGATVKLTQDNDVLDTWFSAALWPFATLDWPHENDYFKTFYPTQVLVTGFDIIFFWVARMIMMGLKFTNKIPFEKVYITGLIRDQDGQKMSKSKGNILDPLDLIDGIDLQSLIEKRTQNLMQPQMAKKIEEATRKQFPNGIPAFGTDALRFTFCALASTGRDIRFDLGRIEGYRNFCNKIWNAARYVLMNTENQDLAKPNEKPNFSLADRWILSRLQNTIQEVKQHFTNYRFDLLAQNIYEFIWNEYCDWYLELSKVVLFSDQNENAKRTTRYVLVQVLETILRLTHPLMPFITEEIWQRVAPLASKTGDTIMLQPYPEYDEKLVDLVSEKELDWIKNLIVSIRNIRSEMNISPGKQFNIYAQTTNSEEKNYLLKNKAYVSMLAKINDITFVEENTSLPVCATALAGEMKILIPMADLIGKEAEMQRLQKEIEKFQKERERAENKLNNQDYVAKAPAAVVEKEKNRLEEVNTALTKLNSQLQQLTKM